MLKRFVFVFGFFFICNSLHAQRESTVLEPSNLDSLKLIQFKTNISGKDQTGKFIAGVDIDSAGIKTFSFSFSVDSLIDRFLYIKIDTILDEIKSIRIIEDYGQYYLKFSDNYSRLDSVYFDFPSLE